MKLIYKILYVSFLLYPNSCVTEYMPEIEDSPDLMVVDGLINDQPGPYTITLSKSLSLGEAYVRKPIKGYHLWITDDQRANYYLYERQPGIYTTDSAKFTGVIGRTYTLHIRANSPQGEINYKSFPMELKPVPPIDSIYYEKVIIKEGEKIYGNIEGCQIYLDTHDSENNCNYYRWKYTEIWEFRLPWNVIHQNCWIYENSSMINVKDVSNLEQKVIRRYPLNYISNTTDRLKHKYCIEVNQYSLNFDEYQYWEKLQFICEDVGNLYDITPSAIPSNIFCIEDPGKEVLGYFSVSAKSSKRFFIKDIFLGITNPYLRCVEDTVRGGNVQGLGVYSWILEEGPDYVIVTNIRDCVDCTTRGTIVEPPFWNENNN